MRKRCGIAEIADVLRREGVDAHLTGFDVLAGHAHQFMFDYPHVVYAEPYAVDAAQSVLADHGFIVMSAGRGGGVQVPDRSRVVLLRKQADAARRFGVIPRRRPLIPFQVGLRLMTLVRSASTPSVKTLIPRQIYDIDVLLAQMVVPDNWTDLAAYARRRFERGAPNAGLRARPACPGATSSTASASEPFTALGRSERGGACISLNAMSW